MEDGYRLVEGIPAPDQYCQLRAVAGLSAKSEEAALAGLPHTLFGAMILYRDAMIGMGRIIGDQGLFYQIVDIAVHPHHQKRGLGKRIMTALTAHLQNTAPPSAYVSLIADGEAHRLYAQFGFKPTAPRSVGMALLIGQG